MAPFTDAELRFADSCAGKAALARAQMIHDAESGPQPAAWTDAMTTAVIRSAAAQDARSRVELSAMNDALPGTLATSDVDRITAEVLMVRDLTAGSR